MRLLIFAALISLVGSLSAQPANAPENLISEQHRLTLEQPGATWEPLLKRLQSKKDIYARFTENRFLPFKKIPQVFTGEIRLSRERGMSLRYLTPEERTLVVDEKGVLAKDRTGRVRELPADARAMAATTALLHVMRFDLSALSQQFDVYAAGDAATWHFAFEPKDEALAKTLARLVVTGEQDQVRRIVMRRSALQSVEILIRDVLDGVNFTADEVQRHFR